MGDEARGIACSGEVCPVGSANGTVLVRSIIRLAIPGMRFAAQKRILRLITTELIGILGGVGEILGGRGMRAPTMIDRCLAQKIDD